MMVDSFLPSMRALVARRLKEDGLSQGKIASLLGLTQASVSSYLSTSPAKQTAALSSFGVTGEEAETYAALMPEVSVNVAYSPEGAKSVEDVVAIPGRIVRVRGQARSCMRPEYGASTHLAAILLEVERKRPSLRAAMNLRYDERMSKVLANLGVKQLTMGRSYPT